MTQVDLHLVRWRHNREFVCEIDRAYSDWINIALFYAALHLVEALFTHDKLPPHTSHLERHRTFKRVNRYKKIWEHYQPLHTAADAARYATTAMGWVPYEQIEQKLIRENLYPLERSVFGLMKRTESPPAITLKG